MQKIITNKGVWLSLTLILMTTFSAQANEWRRVNTVEKLGRIFNDTTLRGIHWPQPELEFNKLPTDWKMEYCRDGTGMLMFWGQPTARKWRLSGNAQACIATDTGEKCYYYEQHVTYGNLYRAGLVGDSRAPWFFFLSGETPSMCDK